MEVEINGGPYDGRVFHLPSQARHLFMYEPRPVTVVLSEETHPTAEMPRIVSVPIKKYQLSPDPNNFKWVAVWDERTP